MQDNLDKARANLERVKRDQNALAALQVDFENLKSRIDDICIKLGIFAGIYSFVSPPFECFVFLTNKND